MNGELGDELPDVRVPPPGPRSRALAARLTAVESPAFDARRARRTDVSGEDHAPIVYARAQGANVIDADENRYVDLTAGFGALILGHPPNAASRAAEAEPLSLALGDVYASEAKVALCEALAALFPERGARVMLGLSGADAVTCALKSSLLTTKKPRVVAFEGSYHGLSYGPLAALGFAPSFREPFASHLGVPVTFAPFPRNAAELDASLGAVRVALKVGDVGAVLVEPILGRGGCIVPPASFLPALRSLADEADALLVLDEIWTGMGRTGAMLAVDDAGLAPDVVCLGKGLGGGAAISACIGSARVMQAWGEHGGTLVHTGTHFGAPPACAAALATLATIRTEGLPDRARDVGERWQATLTNGCAGRATVHGRGLMVGITLADASKALAVARALLLRGFIVLTGGASGNILTLSPPLTIGEPLLDAFATTLSEVL